MAGNIVLFIIISIFLLSVNIECSKLNVPRVLLPIFKDFSTNFTLEATECGCYKWSTSRIDLVQLINVDNGNEQQDCSPRVIVSTISKEPTRNTAIVLAEDIYTGQVLRCDVIVDVIASLNIVTTTRELFMEEAPEAFEVRAYDDQGNEFTTLEGIELEWTLTGPGSTVLRFITFRDSPYETPATVQAFDEIGKQGHIILLEGVKTGSAKVTARLLHPEYKNVNGIEVSLMVIANLLIEPSDIYILRGDVVQYKIIQVKQGRLEEIKLPSSQYYLVSEDPEIGLIEKNSGYLTGLNNGKTRVYLYDRNVNNEKDSGLKLPSATVCVTEPVRIGLSLLPHRNWAILLGEQHDLIVELFASNDHKIHIGDGVQFVTTVDERHFSMSQQSANGSWLTGQAVEQGVSEVETTLTSVVSTRLGHLNIDPKLTTKAEILIFPRIVINPPEVVLPWDPVVRPRYDIDLKVTGGDGIFLWSTSNHTIGVATQTGLVRTQWHGQFDTCASMARNHHNRQCARFHILPPVRMELIEFIMEAEIGMPIYLNVALYGMRPALSAGGTLTQVPFTKCKELPFKVKTSDNNFFYNESAVAEPVGVSCTVVGITGLVAGTSRITVSYKRDDISLEESVTVSAFRPLTLIHPSVGETVLALGTSRYIVFIGGPRPWTGRPSEHVVKVDSTNKRFVDATDVTQKFKVPGASDTYVIKVLCKEYGESMVTLTVYNKPLVPNCKYHESVAHVSIACPKPQFIYLRPEIKVEDSASCPMDLSAEKVIVQSYRDIDLIVKVTDNSGRHFDNITSLDIKWEINPNDLGTVLYKNSISERTFLEENVLLPNKSYQTITPQSQTGIMEVTATVINYHASVLKSNKITNQKLEPITTLITLYLVNDLIVEPNKTSVYNHPMNKQSLSVQQGSGYFELSLSTDSVANVKYDENGRSIEVTPKQPGELHVNVNDLCLMSQPVSVTLNVVHVALIRVEMLDRVGIGKCISAVLRFYDKYDNLMPLPKLEYLDVRFNVEEKIVNLKLVQDDAEKTMAVGEVHYIVTGLHLGDTKITFVAGRGDRQVATAPIDLQVFAPLRLYPRNATLLVGAILQLNTQGGPQPDTNIEYTIESNTVADISSNGILHALSIGYTKVIARSISICPAGVKEVNSEDSIEVHVIPLIGMKISAPLTRFVSGTTVPVWATGLPEKLSSLILGSIDPPVQFIWSTHCSDIIILHGILHPTGVIDDARNKISVRVKGLRPGHCTLMLNVTVPGAVTGSKQSEVLFTSSVEVEVIEGLRLTAPYGFNGQVVLIAPNSKLQLSTNRDGISALKYSIHNESPSDFQNKSLTQRNKPILSINDNGLLQSSTAIGRATVVITGVDEHGLKQMLHVVVQIKPVHYMLLNIKTNWLVPSEENVNVLPLGTEFQLVTSYHDNTGVAFAAAQCDLYVRTSRSDLLEVKRGVDNTSLYVTALQAGPTVLKVWADNCLKTADYIQLYSGQTALPRIESVTSGDVLCMWCPVTDTHRKYGEWSSEPDDVITVNSTSGIGYVNSNRRRHIFVKYGITQAAAIELYVEPVTEVSFVFDKTQIVSNTPGSQFRIPILFKDATNVDKKSNLYTGYQCQDFLENEISEFLFVCDIEFPEKYACHDISTIFTVKPAFNKDLGLYSCNLEASNNLAANTSVIDSYIVLRVYSENGIESEPLHIDFVPAIYVPQTELNINDGTYKAMLSIVGLPTVLKQVTVVPYDKALLEISNVKHASSTTDHYEIRLIDYHWKLNEMEDPLCVTVTSKLTNQNIKIRVKFSGTKSSMSVCPSIQMGSPLGNFMYEHRQSLIIVISMLILFFVTFYAYSHYIQPVINVNVGPDRSLQMNLTPPQMLNTSVPCSPQTCYNRHLNASDSPQMRYGTGDLISDNVCRASPEMRRNRRFL